MREARPWEKFLPPVPPPAFADPWDHAAGPALSVLNPARRIDVPTWAEQGGRKISTAAGMQAWRNDFAPYMTEPSRMATSRRYRAVAFAGPARTVKSESLILNTIGHRIACNPRDMLVVCSTQDTAKQFSERKLAPMIRENSKLAEKQLAGRGADNIHEKRFAGNMNLQIRWPVIGYFSQNEYFDVLLTDLDRMTDDVGGEGAPFLLALKRIQHSGSQGIVIAESSPGFVVTVDDWQPTTLHEAPPCAGGILPIFNTGTRGGWYWTCPHCGDPFRPLFGTLHYERKSTPGESARTVEMVCPNGCCIAPDRKNELNRGGFWLHETADGQSAVPIDDPDVRDTDVVSYWMEGPAAALQTWPELVRVNEQARQTFEETGSDKDLKTTVFQDQGRAYLPQIRSVGDALSAETLKALAEAYPMKVAPAQTRFLTYQVDVQPNRFVVQVDAWGPGLERWLIDRFDIHEPPSGAPGAGERSIDPPRYYEDWSALSVLLDKAYPVAGSGFALLPRAIVVDLHGAKGTTDHAYHWWRHQRKAGNSGRCYIQRGRGGTERDRAVYKAPEKVQGTKKRRRSDLMLIETGTDPLKDEVIMSLTRKEAGPGKYHLPETLAASAFEEFCAEVRTDEGWRERKSGLRNESLDLAVYGKALAIVLKAETITWSRPPMWAAPLEKNTYAVKLGAAVSSEAGDQPTPPPAPVVAKPKPAVAPRRRVRRSSWMS
ncbi:terminase gpA endonuclease subunit [Sinorhizobium americanum]|uniref:Phage terminase large subunit GpA-like protein n=1 Tax=Sinorhizobium americanum TaxID=194963 RepID=A0A4R2BU21_9HYPH|nr:terminase gpA endonuclease subunit [Sinorhizobium americanum]TCN30323.1 phage terminase large subunit GpA-like protein [Sinorhizobium americanum]